MENKVKKTVGIVLFEKFHGRQGIGSSRIRGHWLINHWPEAEVFEQGKKYEAVIFQKTYWLEYLKSYDGIKILDLCDPDWLDTVPIIDVLDNVDAVTVSSEGLQQEIKKFTDKPVYFIPDRQDLTFHNIQKKHEGIAKSVVWFGYSHNVKVLDIVINTLKRNKLFLTVISDCRPPYTKADENIVFDWKNPKWDFNKEILKHDIVLMPANTSPRGRFKSLNKTYTAWSLGMPVATSILELKRFLDPIERQKEADLRLKEVKEKYDVRTSVQEFKNIIKELKESKVNGNTRQNNNINS